MTTIIPIITAITITITAITITIMGMTIHTSMSMARVTCITEKALAARMWRV